MNKVILKQALKFWDGSPTYSQIEKLYKAAQSYQSENNVFFIQAKYRGKAEILNEDIFFEFLSEVALDNGTVKCFEDIEKILNAKSRKENIEATGDSKNSYVKVFEQVVIFQTEDNNPILYKNPSFISTNGPVLAVENGEPFLNIHAIMSRLGFSQFVYLGGFSNSITREFLRDKEVVFFLDFDIEAIRIYDSFECKKKSFFRPPDIEDYFDKYGNHELYLKQRAVLPESHAELQWLIELIKRHSAVVEQEIID